MDTAPAKIVKEINYPFGILQCYEHYVIGTLNVDAVVNTAVASTILNDINDFYGRHSIVYISNREFGHEVDMSVYKLVNAKRMIGIAIVSENPGQLTQAAQEQKLYSGSFGFFKDLKSAIAWANLLTSAHKNN